MAPRKQAASKTEAPRRGAAFTPRGRVVMETIDSRVLKGNPLGDPHVRTLPVYLPPGYDKGSRRYPVIVALTGFTGSGRMMLNVSNFSEALDERLDRLIGSGVMKPCIVVMPDCFTRFGGSQYINSRATGRYEDHLVREVVPYVDKHFRTLPLARHRAVAGKSSGGYGALVHGMKHPEVFSALACHSGDLYFEYCYQPDFAKAMTAMWLAGGPSKWFQRFLSMPKKPHSELLTLNIIAMTACYSPNPRMTLGCEFPFDLKTGEMRPAIWKKWQQHDPLHMLGKHVRSLKKLRLVYLDAGIRDEWNLHLGARIFADHAAAKGVKLVHQEFDDGHMDISYRYDVSLPLLAKAIS